MNESTQEAINTSENADYLTIGDIIAFFAAYRKLILIPTVVLSILLFIFLIFTPLLTRFVNPNTSNAYVTVISVPSSVQSALIMQQSVQQQITTLLNSPPFLLDVLNSFDSEYLKIDSYEKISDIVQHRWIGSNLTITVRLDNSEDFLKLLLNKLTMEITAELNSLYELYLVRNDSILAQVEQLLSSYFVEEWTPESLIGISVLNFVNQRLSVIGYFGDGIITIWENNQILIEEPNENIGISTSIIFMISAIAANFILFSVLALIVNFFRSIQNNPVEKEKIRNALSSTK